MGDKLFGEMQWTVNASVHSVAMSIREVNNRIEVEDRSQNG